MSIFMTYPHKRARADKGQEFTALCDQVRAITSWNYQSGGTVGQPAIYSDDPVATTEPTAMPGADERQLMADHSNADGTHGRGYEYTNT